MSNNNEQNGRQPPLPQQTAPSTTASTAPTDPRIRNTTQRSSMQVSSRIRCRIYERYFKVLPRLSEQNRLYKTRLHIFTYDKRGAKPIFDYWSDT
ncbi:hypothetical protein PYW07_013539 [Mythimna separata]|uniref:Uncharacterized protein n=1 Tax=Mythimna separata TaxID=271217 RepID=A0AAD7YAU4_MYTSE|nr:hypothetical protein PYW07_013539 [Mythimna separata]